MAVAFMYCSINVLASVVALNNVVASSGYTAQAERVMQMHKDNVVHNLELKKPQ